ncbi:hypothetical protein Patl1_01356 [Pistacia atlantica]|uniref:Uncharacterized protein n=1 Tax=Pistacia atlantica TaxID=434234 RepID=A0ACC1CC83_9ROSI|nr:hypothetical protein Patl1_01356 [Pistacia atlantica]
MHLSDVETLQPRLNFGTKIGSEADETHVRLCEAALFTRLIIESESHTEIDKSIKQEVENDSIAWRKRLLSE